MPSDVEALAIKQRVESRLMAIPGVHAVGFGGKVTAGEPTGNFAIRVHVLEKKPAAQVPPDELIPPEIEGVKTDVVESGPREHHSVLEGGTRIVAESISGGQERSSTGTLGCVARRAGTADSNPPDVLLSNAHVLYQEDRLGQNDDAVYVTSCSDCSKSLVARTKRFAYDNLVDAAIAEIAAGQDVRAHAYHKPITGTLDLSPENLPNLPQAVRDRIWKHEFQVHKFGQKTGLTHGLITDANLLVSVDGHQFQHQIEVTPMGPATAFSDKGDSGAVIFDNDWKVVALLWGGTKDKNTAGVKTTNASPIKYVEDALQIRIAKNPPVAVWRITGEAPPPISERVHRDLVSSVQGRRLLELYGRHGDEVRRLLRQSRPFIVAWHRNHGPAMVRALMDLAQERASQLPDRMGDQPVESCIRQIADTLLREGSPALQEDVSRYLPLAVRLGGRSYEELQSTLLAFEGQAPVPLPLPATTPAPKL